MQSLWDALKRVEGKIKHLHICTKISKNNIKKTISIAMPDPKMMDQTCKCTWLRYLFRISRSNVWRNGDFSPLGRWAPLWDQQRTTNSEMKIMKTWRAHIRTTIAIFWGGVAQPFLARGVEQADIVTLGEHWTIAFLKRFGPRVEKLGGHRCCRSHGAQYMFTIFTLYGDQTESGRIMSLCEGLSFDFGYLGLTWCNLPRSPEVLQDCCAAKMIPSSQQQGRGQGHQGWMDVSVCKTWSQPGFFWHWWILHVWIWDWFWGVGSVVDITGKIQVVSILPLFGIKTPIWQTSLFSNQHPLSNSTRFKVPRWSIGLDL